MQKTLFLDGPPHSNGVGAILSLSTTYFPGAQKETNVAEAPTGTVLEDCLPDTVGWAAYHRFLCHVGENKTHKLLSQQNTSLLYCSMSFHKEFHSQGVELKHCSRFYAKYMCPQGCPLFLPGTLSVGMQNLAKVRQRVEQCLMGDCF